MKHNNYNFGNIALGLGVVASNIDENNYNRVFDYFDDAIIHECVISYNKYIDKYNDDYLLQCIEECYEYVYEKSKGTFKDTISSLKKKANATFFDNAENKSKREVAKTLGIKKRDLGDEKKVAAARRNMSKKHHPDKGGSTQKMQDINNAFDIATGNTKKPYKFKKLKDDYAEPLVQAGTLAGTTAVVGGGAALIGKIRHKMKLRKQRKQRLLDANKNNTKKIMDNDNFNNINNKGKYLLDALYLYEAKTKKEIADILGIDINDLNDDSKVKAAYRAASLKHHPDRGGNESTMKDVNDAWSTHTNKNYASDKNDNQPQTPKSTPNNNTVTPNNNTTQTQSPKPTPNNNTATPNNTTEVPKPTPNNNTQIQNNTTSTPNNNTQIQNNNIKKPKPIADRWNSMGTGGKVATSAAAATGVALGINAIRKRLKQRKMAQQQYYN